MRMPKRVGKMRNAYKMLIGNPERKRSSVKTRGGWGNIELILKKEGVTFKLPSGRVWTSDIPF
jgi:hypothetical protein